MGAEIRMRKILLVEDDPQDVELTLAALDEYHLVSRVVVARRLPNRTIHSLCGTFEIGA